MRTGMDARSESAEKTDIILLLEALLSFSGGLLQKSGVEEDGKVRYASLSFSSACMMFFLLTLLKIRSMPLKKSLFSSGVRVL